MNQILFNSSVQKKYKYIFLGQLFFSLVVILASISYVFYLIVEEYNRNKISDSLLQPFSISKLYSTINIPYEEHLYSSPFIIGTIEFPNLSLELPILSEMNDELLSLSVCRFYGPMPNEIGNICIAGHNYNNGSHFSDIPKLLIGDTILLTDRFHRQISYKIYDKYEIDKKDLSCTSQETNGQKEITLVTCNNFTGNRIIIKAK